MLQLLTHGITWISYKMLVHTTYLSDDTHTSS